MIQDVPTPVQLREARRIVSASRMSVIRLLPYFSDPTLSLRPFVLPGLGTFGVSATSHMAYDPYMAIQWEVRGCATIVLHEALHILLDHCGRRGDRELFRWNIAADMEDNRIIVDAGFSFPDGTKPVLSDDYDFDRGKRAEWYYDQITDEMAEELRSRIVSPFPGCGTACGTGVGNPQGWEANVEVLSNGLEGQSPSSRRIMRRATAEKIVAAARGGRMRGWGSIPGGLQMWAEMQLTPPVIPWTRVLTSLVRGAIGSRAGADDYTRSRISRRSMGLRGRVASLPALHSPQPEVAIVLDVSGSMMGEPVRQGVSEVVGVVRALGLPVWTLAVDMVVQVKVRVSSAADVEKLNAGAGGTDMVAGIEAADKLRPDVIVVITDAETPWPTADKLPRAKLVVAVVGDTYVPAYLGRVVRIPVDKTGLEAA